MAAVLEGFLNTIYFFVYFLASFLHSFWKTFGIFFEANVDKQHCCFGTDNKIFFCAKRKASAQHV